MFLLSIVFINGVMEALFAIGGVMVGEHDLGGFSLLARKSLLTVGLLVALIMVLMWIPDVVGAMFGIEESHELAALNQVLRIYSMLLLPFALTLTLVAVYMVLERMVLSVVVIVAQLAVLVLTLWLFATHVPAHVWYGFPLAAFLFLGAQMACSYIISRRQGCRVSCLTLIPYSEGGQSLDCSVPYRLEEVAAALEQIVAFLERMKVDKATIFKLRLCLEELMTNIAQHSTGRVVHHSFDVHTFVKDQHVRITLKDGGHPFDPIQAGHDAEAHRADTDDSNLGVYIAVNIIKDISYKYMFGLNVVLIKV